jgi:hypothetical protein
VADTNADEASLLLLLVCDVTNVCAVTGAFLQLLASPFLLLICDVPRMSDDVTTSLLMLTSLPFLVFLPLLASLLLVVFLMWQASLLF